MVDSQSKSAPIHRIGGKFKLVGTLFLAVGLIASLSGIWWGPAMLFPGAATFFIGRWFE